MAALWITASIASAAETQHVADQVNAIGAISDNQARRSIDEVHHALHARLVPRVEHHFVPILKQLLSRRVAQPSSRTRHQYTRHRLSDCGAQRTVRRAMSLRNGPRREQCVTCGI